MTGGQREAYRGRTLPNHERSPSETPAEPPDAGPRHPENARRADEGWSRRSYRSDDEWRTTADDPTEQRGGPGHDSDGDQDARPPSRPPAPCQGPTGPASTAKGTKGLTFERRWTRPGVHPYDEIAWETRTAAIGNESGKIVFEQKDVEVPEFWSQLATNVVVSKYFRGHVGTPERETSVRQLIDRVVNTIAAWAETQRYFATDEDLEGLPGRADPPPRPPEDGFNSPVWFNVGIEPKPQCSACFINSVQDTMS